MMSSSAGVYPIRGGVMDIPLPAMAAAILAIAVVTGLLIGTQSLEVVSAVVAAGIFCAFLISAPVFWLAALLVVLIPFQGLITQSLGGFGSNARQLFAVWKEVLLLIGIFRVVYSNTNRNNILRANRWVLFWGGFLVLVYGVAFLRAPSVPAVFSIDNETRFLAVMLFFMFLRLDERHIAILLRLMLCSIGLVAIYGLIQYFWDYQRLLPLVNHPSDLNIGGIRRIYSYSLDVFDPAYGAMIVVIILFSGAGRTKLRVALPWFALLVPCLLLTYVRSAYLGLLAGIITVYVVDRGHRRRHAVIGIVTLSILCASFVFGGTSVYDSNLGQRFQSISSQTDDSSIEHKARMEHAVELISANPFGIGLGKYGTVQSRFAGGVDKAQYAENWVLNVAVQAGVVAAFTYLALTGAILLSLLRPRRHVSKETSTLRAAAGGVLVAMTVAGIMIPVWDFLIPVVYACALVGMALQAQANPRTAQQVGHTCFRA